MSRVRNNGDLLRIGGIALMMLLSMGWATAELQDAVINGHYLVSDEDRKVEVTPLHPDIPEGTDDFIRMIQPTDPPSLRNKGFAYFQRIEVPALLNSKQYRDLRRVFLSFYLGLPDGFSGQIDMLITIDDCRVYTGLFSEPGWHPRLVDLSLWAGKTVELQIRTSCLKGDVEDVILGLPRFVSCFGPDNDGGGGISSGPRHHGKPSAMGDQSLTIRKDSTKIDGGPLVITRFDCIEASTLRMHSAVQEYTMPLDRGLHWVALQMPTMADSEAGMKCKGGIVERGPIDIIPNFMVEDKKKIEAIILKLDPLHIPLSLELFQLVE